MKYTELKLKQIAPFRKPKWKAERTVLIIMSFIIFTAFFGIIGAGPLSKRTLGSSEEGFKVEVQSLLRYKKDFQLRIFVSPTLSDKDFRIRINKSFLRAMNTIKITPEPDMTYIGKENYVFSFNELKRTDETTITFLMRPLITGDAKLLIGEENGKTMEMEVYIYP